MNSPLYCQDGWTYSVRREEIFQDRSDSICPGVWFILKGMLKKPLILVTNDDGIESPGLRAAAEAVMGLGEVMVVAPTTQQTSMSRSLAGNPNDFLHRIDYEVNGQNIPAHHINCSPARLMLHAVDVLFSGRKPDLLVSGINYGENLGNNIGLSATVGAAFQGAAMGIPALAMSLATAVENHHHHADLNWTAASHFTTLFAEKMLSAKMPADVDVINVNVPADATKDTEWRMTRQSRRHYYDNHIQNPAFESRIGDGGCIIDIDEKNLEPDSDIYALAIDRIVSVTPLSIDSTSRETLDQPLLSELWRGKRD